MQVLKVKESATEEPREVGKGSQYWVHYKGWKQKWDEWVNESRLLKLNEENLRLQRDLNEIQRVKDVPDNHHQNSNHNTHKLSSKIINRDHLQIPRKARNLRGGVVSLPRTPTVKKLLEEYEEYTINEPITTTPQSKNLIKEVNAGLKVYFDRSLGHSLLYRNERQQFIDIRKKLKGKLPSEIYGAEHLLRLIVNLPEMISHTKMEPEIIGIVQEHIAKILEWLVTEQSRVIQSPYIETSTTYQKINQSI
ncbi:hypothetical protein PSHT_04534 [Puccinia striiformis]|uniref:Chromatin modification-related protein EAF3 n=1 Tax=Puccinia striiformis TaxID=27350 RepID=A0A2S4WCN8_9BASI|nr:hypothetical protein PSHT_04534 [Puccinia striiformis]